MAYSSERFPEAAAMREHMDRFNPDNNLGNQNEQTTFPQKKQQVEEACNYYEKGKKNIKTAKYLGIASLLTLPLFPISLILGGTAAGFAIGGSIRKNKAINPLKKEEFERLKAKTEEPSENSTMEALIQRINRSEDLTPKEKEKLVKSVAVREDPFTEKEITRVKKDITNLNKKFEKALMKVAKRNVKKEIEDSLKGDKHALDPSDSEEE